MAPPPQKNAESRNVLALFVMLGIGFGGGLLASSFLHDRDVQKRIDLAVEQARKECDARLELARQAGAGSTSESGSASQAGGEGDEGVRGKSGKDMIEKYLQQKGPATAPPPAPTPGNPAPKGPGTAASSAAPAERKDEEPGFARVMEVSGRPGGGAIHAVGTVKNMGSGPCRDVTVEVTARDARGVTVGTRTTGASPGQLESYATATFDVAFPEDSGAANFSAQATCN